MSLSRATEDARWFGPNPPGYVYVTDGKFGKQFNVPLRTVGSFCEHAMRALEQSGELDDDELESAQKALAERFDYVDMDPVPASERSDPFEGLDTAELTDE